MHSSTQSGRLANQCDHTQNMFCWANVLADKVMDKSKKRQSPLFDQPTQHPNIRSGMCHNMHSNIQSGRLATQCDHIPNMFFCSDNVAAEKSHGQNRKSVNPRCLTNPPKILTCEVACATTCTATYNLDDSQLSAIILRTFFVLKTCLRIKSWLTRKNITTSPTIQACEVACATTCTAAYNLDDSQISAIILK
jgi:hypothetical protein